MLNDLFHTDPVHIDIFSSGSRCLWALLLCVCVSTNLGLPLAFSCEEMSEYICERTISAVPGGQYTHTHTQEKKKPRAMVHRTTCQLCTTMVPSINSMHGKQNEAGSSNVATRQLRHLDMREQRKFLSVTILRF